MDLLMRELRKKRQSLESDFGGKKLLRRSEIEEKNIQKIREEEQREIQAKALRQQSLSSSSASFSAGNSSSSDQNPSTKSSLPPALASLAATSSSKKQSSSLSEEQRIDDLVLTRQEVIRRFRILKQPITLFGEDDDARLERLKTIFKSGVLDIDSDIAEGQTNDFLRDIDEMRKRQKPGSFSRETKHKRDDSDGLECTGVEDGDKSLSGDGASSGTDADKDLKRLKTNFEELGHAPSASSYTGRLGHAPSASRYHSHCYSAGRRRSREIRLPQITLPALLSLSPLHLQPSPSTVHASHHSSSSTAPLYLAPAALSITSSEASVISQCPHIVALPLRPALHSRILPSAPGTPPHLAKAFRQSGQIFPISHCYLRQGLQFFLLQQQILLGILL